MKKTLIIIVVALISYTGFSQKSISVEVSSIINAINSVAIGKKVELNDDIVQKHIRNMQGVSEVNKLIKDYDSNGKWLKDGIAIPEELKPNINVKDETLVYFSKMKAELEFASITLNIKAHITKIKAGQPLEITYYIDYTVYNAEGKQLLSVEIME